MNDHRKLVEVLEDVWDDGSAKGLDGWVGPGRGTLPIDDYAVYGRERAIDKALTVINEPFELPGGEMARSKDSWIADYQFSLQCAQALLERAQAWAAWFAAERDANKAGVVEPERPVRPRGYAVCDLDVDEDDIEIVRFTRIEPALTYIEEQDMIPSPGLYALVGG